MRTALLSIFTLVPSIASAHELPFGHAHPHPDRWLVALAIGVVTAGGLWWASRGRGRQR